MNAGISGEASSGLLSRIGRVVFLKPDIVILCTGANNAKTGLWTLLQYPRQDNTVFLIKDFIWANLVQMCLFGDQQIP